MNYYSIAAAVRTVNPSYRMTVGQFFGFFGYQILTGLLTFIATIFFIIPGLWIGIKVSLAPYIYAITNGEPDAIGKSWNLTTGYYWHTLGFTVLLALGVFAAILVGELIAFLPAGRFPAAMIIGLPVAVAVIAWTMHAQSLGYVRWTKVLLAIHGRPVGADPNSLPPATV